MLISSSRSVSLLIVASLLLVPAMILGGGFPAYAGDLSWSGLYRMEAIKIKNAELTSQDSNKSYLLHHLVLSPKIVASDGITVYGRFDIFNNSSFGQDQQSGEVIGLGPGTRHAAGASGTNSSDSNTQTRNQRSGDLAVTNLYVTWVQEFGVLVAGRTPLHFGLGVAHNAGQGLFDHWMTNRDLVGYKFVLGNLFLMPMLGKVNEGDIGYEDDVNDYMLHFQYDNPETDLSIGVFYELRVAGISGNDTPVNNNYMGGTSSTVYDGYKHQLISLYSSQRLSDVTVGVEANLLSGEPGVQTTPERGLVKLNSYAVAGELDWKPPQGNWFGNFKLGLVSGDDPGTKDTYEGFVFNRNYDVAMLMFNHPLGQNDFFRTGLNRTFTQSASSYTDVEAISNAIYFAPSITNRWRDNFTWGATFIYALLNKDPIAGSAGSKNLGFEVDLNVTYKPFERLTWVTELGMLWPGEGFKGSTTQSYENKMAYGIITKAAISF